MPPAMVGQQRIYLTLESLNQPWIVFFTFLSNWKTSALHLVQEDFYNKVTVVKNCVKNHLKIFLSKSCKSCIQTENDRLCFYKSSSNQNFTFIKVKCFILRSFLHIKYSKLRKRSFSCHYMFHIAASESRLQ